MRYSVIWARSLGRVLVNKLSVITLSTCQLNISGHASQLSVDKSCQSISEVSVSQHVSWYFGRQLTKGGQICQPKGIQITQDLCDKCKESLTKQSIFKDYSLLYQKHLSFAGAHWQMNTTLYQIKSTRRHVKLDKFIFKTPWLLDLLCKHWFASSVWNFCSWVADVPPRETSLTEKSEEKQMFSQANNFYVNFAEVLLLDGTAMSISMPFLSFLSLNMPGWGFAQKGWNRCLYISHNTPCLPPKFLHEHCLLISLRTTVIPKRN